jgi:hypothetical protein
MMINIKKLKNALEIYPNFLSIEKMIIFICSSLKKNHYIKKDYYDIKK